MIIKQIFQEEYPENKKTTFFYKSNYFYDIQFEVKNQDDGWLINITKKPFSDVFVKNIEGVVFDNNLDNAEYFIALNDDNVEVGWICVIYQKWNNLARLWDIEVDERYRNQGIGKLLLDFAERTAKNWNCRAIILECQSSNFPAISFYRKNGFNLTGVDLIAYSNEDIEKCEVRLEMSKKLI